MPRSQRRRVFQVATGNVGSEMVRRLRDHPDLEPVGLHCYTADKVGRDAGEIVGIGALGVLATDRIEDIVAAAPDCVNFNGVWPDMELFRAVLEAGINVVSTADWITGHHRDRNHPLASGQKPTEAIEAASGEQKIRRHRHRMPDVHRVAPPSVECRSGRSNWSKHLMGIPLRTLQG